MTALQPRMCSTYAASHHLISPLLLHLSVSCNTLKHTHTHTFPQSQTLNTELNLHITSLRSQTEKHPSLDSFVCTRLHLDYKHSQFMAMTLRILHFLHFL